MNATDTCSSPNCHTDLIVDDIDDNGNPSFENGFRCDGCTELTCYAHSNGLFCNACNEVG
jgi:hypothetical protein